MSIDKNIVDFEADETKDYRDGQAEIQPMAEALIKECEELEHLSQFEIRFIFAKKPMQAKGRRVLGKASKFSDRNKLLHKWDFMVIIDEQFWNLCPDAREALLHHELMHCGVNKETGKTTMKAHDLEEFGATVRRYGAWLGDIKSFSSQLEMFGESEKSEVAL